MEQGEKGYGTKDPRKFWNKGFRKILEQPRSL
jgi:hypothetical protein